MQVKKMIVYGAGVVAVVAGLYMFTHAQGNMDKTTEKVRHKVTGSYSSGTKHNVMGGIGLIVVGAGLLFYGFRCRCKKSR